MSLRPIYSENRHGERYMQLLGTEDPRVRLYVYRVENDRIIKPAIYKAQPPFLEYLEAFLRDEFGAREYYVMFRRGETMLEAGAISICPMLSRQ